METKRQGFEWRVVKTFEEQGVAVDVSRLSRRAPEYSIAIGRSIPQPEGLARWSRNIRVAAKPSNGIVQLQTPEVVIAKLLAAACAWIAMDAQAACDAVIERDLRAARPKASPVKFASHVGKSEEHRRRHERNLAERREKDRRNAHGGRG